MTGIGENLNRVSGQRTQGISLDDSQDASLSLKLFQNKKSNKMLLRVGGVWKWPRLPCSSARDGQCPQDAVTQDGRSPPLPPAELGTEC